MGKRRDDGRVEKRRNDGGVRAMCRRCCCRRRVRRRHLRLRRLLSETEVRMLARGQAIVKYALLVSADGRHGGGEERAAGGQSSRRVALYKGALG